MIRRQGRANRALDGSNMHGHTAAGECGLKGLRGMIRRQGRALLALGS